MKLASRMVLGLVVVAAMATLAMAAEPPAAPKVSTFAPAKDVAAQIEAYVERLEESVQSEAEFKEAEAKLAKDSNTLILLALAAGLHDEDVKYKAAAPGLIKATQELAKAKGFAAAKAGVAAVKKALDSKEGNPAELKWGKSASLPDLMKQVPLINSRLKRNLRGTKLTSKAKDNAGDSTTLAVIAQGSMADTSETKSEDQVAKWFGFCVQMRDAATALNKAVEAKDSKAADKAMSDLNQSCDDCHNVFHKVEKKEE